MSVAFRVGTATALLVLLLLSVLAYHVSTVRQLERVHRDLSTHQVQAILLALEHRRTIDRVGDNARKLAVTRDARYASQIAVDLAATAARLRTLRGLLPPDAAGVVAEAEREVIAFREALPSLERLSAKRDPKSREQMIAPALAALESLRSNARGLIRASEQALTERVEWSSRAVSDAQRMALYVFAAALALGLAAVLLTVIPINRRLQALVDAARNVSEENYEHRIATPPGDEFSRLTLAFNSMVGRLGELDQLKKNLISHVSHELRTPLASIQESQTLLLEELPGRLNAQQKRLLEHNVASCSRLSRMISNLLDLSRMEAGALRYALADHDLRSLVIDVIDEQTGRAATAGIHLEAELSPDELPIRCDRDRLAQVFRNLIDNALKFSPAQTTVTVRAHARVHLSAELPPRVSFFAREQTGLVLFEVSDGGPGVAVEEREKIFGRFYRASGEGRSGRGVGLGLAICWEIVDAHGGAIWAAGNERGGASFCVLLPLASAETAHDELVPGASVA